MQGRQTPTLREDHLICRKIGLRSPLYLRILGHEASRMVQIQGLAVVRIEFESARGPSQQSQVSSRSEFEFESESA